MVRDLASVRAVREAVEDLLVDGLLGIEDGRTVVPDRPGLGIEINWDQVDRYQKLFEQVGQYPM